MKNLLLPIILVALLTSCNTETQTDKKESLTIDTLQGVSLLGTELISKQLDPQKDSARISDYLLASNKYASKPDNADALVWKGRRMAYLGDYKAAIEIFSEGIKKFPDDARM